MRNILYPLTLSLLLAGAASAQTPGFDQLQRDAAWSELGQARLQAQAAQRDAFAAEQRYRSQQTIQALSQASPYASPPVAGVRPPATSAQLAADAERLRQLQDQELAASNARIQASDPPPKK